jgi:ABC-type branched-subunit amino acid transport system ATPase component
VQLVVTPDSVFGMLTSAQALIVALFGGVGTLWGPLIGSAILIPLSETLQANLGDKIPGIQGVVYGIAIILVVLLAPEGIFWRVRDWLRRPRAVGLGQVDPIAPPIAAAAPEPAPQQRQPILTVSNLSKSFGGLRAVADASFTVGDGEILGIIGPNGAGKTTLFNLLNGFLPPDGGSVTFAGHELIGLKPNRVCRLGIGRTFQVVRAFARLSVLDNVVVGAYAKTTRDAEAVAAATTALAQVGLTGRAGALAGSLTNKELRLMELARALAGHPRLLLMDEPLAGLASHEIEDMLEVIRALAAQGTTVVIIEHTMRAMVRLAERFIVLDHGAILAKGHPGEIVKDESVIEAYLGKKWAAIRARG